MEYTIEHAGSFVRIFLKGDLTAASSAPMFDELVALALVRGGRIVLNLEGLQSATPAGLRSIFVAARLLHVRQGRLAVYGARLSVLENLVHRGITYAFRAFDFESEAEAYVQGPLEDLAPYTAMNKADNRPAAQTRGPHLEDRSAR